MFQIKKSCFVYVCALVLSGCGQGDQGTGRLAGLRCAKDGLCAEAIDSRSIEFGYREGADEVRMDVIYRPRGSQMKSGRPFSVRIIQQDGRPISHASSGSNPDSWQGRKTWTVETHALPVEEQRAQDDTRAKLLTSMLENLNTKPCPEGLNSEAWEEAKEQLEDLVAHLTLPADGNDRDAS